MTVIAGLVIKDGILACSDEGERRNGRTYPTQHGKIRPISKGPTDAVVGYSGDVERGSSIIELLIPYSYLSSPGSGGTATYLNAAVGIYEDAVRHNFEKKYLKPLGIDLDELLRGTTTLPPHRSQELLRIYYSVRREFGAVDILVAGYNVAAGKFDVCSVVPGSVEAQTLCERRVSGSHIAIGSGYAEAEEVIGKYLGSERAAQEIRSGGISKVFGAMAILDAVDEARACGNAVGRSHLVFMDGKNEPVYYEPSGASLLTNITRLVKKGDIRRIKTTDINRLFEDIMEDVRSPQSVADDLLDKMASRKRKRGHGRKATTTETRYRGLLKSYLLNINR